MKVLKCEGVKVLRERERERQSRNSAYPYPKNNREDLYETNVIGKID